MTQPRELIRRLGIAGILVALVFLFRLLYQSFGPTRSYWLPFTCTYLILIAFAGYQVLRAVALIAVSRGTKSPLLQALHLRGVRGTTWEIYRRRLAPRLRLPLILTLWACIILGVIWSLWRTQSLDALQARLMGSAGGSNDTTGIPLCRVVTLETPDNNLGRYYRAITNLARDLHAAGAKIVLAEESRFEGPHSQWWNLLDSLTHSGVLLYESGEGRPQSLPLPNPAPGDWRHARFLDQARPLPEENPTMIAFRPVPSWYDGQQLHVALQAVAKLRGERTIQQPFYMDGAIRYADLQIPVTKDGESYAPADGRSRKSFAAAVFLRGDTLFYMENRRSDVSPTMPPSLASLVRGQIVMIRWVDAGGLRESGKDARLSFLPSIIEALQRGRLFTPVPVWHQVITLVVLLLGAGLSLGKHLRVASAVLVLVALVILAADLWLFSSLSLVTDLVYPALAALLAGLLFPLATHFHRHL